MFHYLVYLSVAYFVEVKTLYVVPISDDLEILVCARRSTADRASKAARIV